MRILVTYAVQGEFTELKFPGLIGEEEVQIGYLRTGVGKVKSAFYLSEAISHAQPDLVVNVGTAGTIRHQVGDIFVCRHLWTVICRSWWSLVWSMRLIQWICCPKRILFTLAGRRCMQYGGYFLDRTLGCVR